MTDATMTTALVRFKAKQGHVAMRELLERVAGARTASDVPADRVMAVIEACEADGVDSKMSKASASKAPKPDFHDPAFVAACYDRFGGR